jgi:AcrR family transcriptional regulator
LIFLTSDTILYCSVCQSTSLVVCKALNHEPGPRSPAERNVEALDERVRRSRAAVLGVTAQLLFERGFGGATVDEISRRSGVAKTTIYRHWPTRTDLLRDACSTLGTPLDAPDTGSFEADVTALMTNLAHLLQSINGPRCCLDRRRLSEIRHRHMYSKLQQGYSQPFETVIRRALRRGELPPNTDAAMLVAALTGPLFYRRWFSREPLTDDFAKQIVLHVLP